MTGATVRLNVEFWPGVICFDLFALSPHATNSAAQHPLSGHVLV
jgi:hypothetical protein